VAHSPAGRTLLALTAALALSVGAASCGGTQISADEVESAPPELTIPSQSEESADVLAEPGEDAPSSSSGDSDSADPDAPTDSGAGAGDDPATGGASAPNAGSGSGSDSGSSTPQPQATAAPSNPGASEAPEPSTNSTGGSQAGTEKFEEFCQQNAGAC
jgi:hypothetical protein